jgi:hypothetical protein
MYHVMSRLSATFLVATLGLSVAEVGTTLAASGVVGKATKHSSHHRVTHATHPGVLGGFISSSSPVVIEISNEGREVTQMATALPLRCSQGEGLLVTPSYFEHVPISAKGAFEDSLEASVNLPNNMNGKVTSHVAGRFNHMMTAVTGTWSLAVVIHDATGATLNSCDSEPTSFTAVE